MTTEFNNLPDDIKKFLTTRDLMEKTEALARSLKLDLDAEGEMSLLSARVLMGLLHPSDFVKRIKENLRVDESRAREIGTAVNAAIFRSFRDSIKKIYNIEDLPREEKETALHSEAPHSPTPSRGAYGETVERVEEAIQKEPNVVPLTRVPYKETATLENTLEHTPTPVAEDIRKYIDVLPSPEASTQITEEEKHIDRSELGKYIDVVKENRLSEEEGKEEGLDREALLHDIENPRILNGTQSLSSFEQKTTPPPLSENSFEERLRKIVTTPKEEIQLGGRSYSKDPYRESVQE